LKIVFVVPEFTGLTSRTNLFQTPKTSNFSVNKIYHIETCE